jgi:hypothetical protein
MRCQKADGRYVEPADKHVPKTVCQTVTQIIHYVDYTHAIVESELVLLRELVDHKTICTVRTTKPTCTYYNVRTVQNQRVGLY